MTTWEEATAALAGVVADLPDGAVLELLPVDPATGGWQAQVWPHGDWLFARVREEAAVGPDRPLPEPARQRLRDLGFADAATDGKGPWLMLVDRSASPAADRVVADRLIVALRDAVQLATPREVAHRGWTATGEALSWPELGLDRFDIGYYARLGIGATAERPTQLLRRVSAGWRTVDTALDGDGGWVPTDVLDRRDLMELDDDVVRLDDARAARLLTAWRTPVAADVATADRPRFAAVARDDAGRPAPADQPPLDPFERVAVAAYLGKAPMVVAALGFDDDPFDPGGPEKLPLSIHTDAVWIWSESAAYFAARYALPPDPSLVRHIRRRDYRWPELDRTALERIGRQIRNGETG